MKVHYGATGICSVHSASDMEIDDDETDVIEAEPSGGLSGSADLASVVLQ